MPATNAKTRKLTGHAQLAISATPLGTQWKDVEQELTKLTGGTYRKAMLASVGTKRYAGDAITVTSTTLKDMPASVEISKWTGDAKIVIGMCPRDMLAPNVRINRWTGTARTALGIYQRVMPARNVRTNK